MTITADRPHRQPEGTAMSTPVINFHAQDRASAVVTPAADAAGALEAAPECPAFPQLPDDIQHALADFDARVADGSLPMDGDGYPAIPPAAEAWISDFLRSHIPTEI